MAKTARRRQASGPAAADDRERVLAAYDWTSEPRPRPVRQDLEDVLAWVDAELKGLTGHTWRELLSTPMTVCGYLVPLVRATLVGKHAEDWSVGWAPNAAELLGARPDERSYPPAWRVARIGALVDEVLRQSTIPRGAWNLLRLEFRDLENAPFRLGHHRSQEQRRAAGRVAKRRELIWQRVCDVVKANPQATVEDVFQSLPEAGRVRNESEALVYRDGSKLVQVDDRTGREKALTKRALERYVSDAKKLGSQ